jgi:hypothetical protein
MPYGKVVRHRLIPSPVGEAARLANSFADRSGEGYCAIRRTHPLTNSA